MGEDMPSNMLSFINFESLEFYWTYFLALQTTTPKIPRIRLMSLDHKPKMRCCGMSSNYGPWWDYIAMSFGSWASASFLWIWTLLGFKIDSPKIHDNVDVVWVTTEMRPCGVKNLSSTIVTVKVYQMFASSQPLLSFLNCLGLVFVLNQFFNGWANQCPPLFQFL